MKKALSILTIGFILLSGMHLSVANHICGGRNVATKLSFDEEKASCGMKSDLESPCSRPTFSRDCCHDHISDFIVDNQYQPTSFELKKIGFQLLHVFSVPIYTILHTHQNTQNLYTNVIPPGNLAANEVSLSSICVFRI